MMTVDNLDLPPDRKPLYDFGVRANRIVRIDNHNPDCLGIDSREVLRMIGTGDVEWEKMVPEPVV